MQNEDVDYGGGANQISLSTARNSFIDFGASERRFIQNVRSPMLSELPPLGILRELETHHIAAIREKVKLQILAIARGMLSRHIGVAEGSIYLSSLVHNLEPAWSDKAKAFLAVASETDDLPLGPVRQHWTSDALARKDHELADYEARIREHVLNACRETEQELRSDLLGLRTND